MQKPLKKGTVVKVRTTNGGETIGVLTANYRPTYDLHVKHHGYEFVIEASRVKWVRQYHVHSYDVEVLQNGQRWIVRNVEAMNRNSAAAKVRKDHPGSEIASVNMVG